MVIPLNGNALSLSKDGTLKMWFIRYVHSQTTSIIEEVDISLWT